MIDVALTTEGPVALVKFRDTSPLKMKCVWLTEGEV